MAISISDTFAAQLLIEAAREGRTKTVKELLKAGVDPHIYDALALRLADDAGHETTAAALRKAMLPVHHFVAPSVPKAAP